MCLSLTAGRGDKVCEQATHLTASLLHLLQAASERDAALDRLNFQVCESDSPGSGVPEA